MNIKEIVGLNTKYYGYKLGLTQEKFANLTNFKMAYISIVENGKANLTLDNIKIIADSLNIKPELLFNIDTAREALILPNRIYKINLEQS